MINGSLSGGNEYLPCPGVGVCHCQGKRFERFAISHSSRLGPGQRSVEVKCEDCFTIGFVVPSSQDEGLEHHGDT